MQLAAEALPCWRATGQHRTAHHRATQTQPNQDCARQNKCNYAVTRRDPCCPTQPPWMQAPGALAMCRCRRSQVAADAARIPAVTSHTWLKLWRRAAAARYCGCLPKLQPCAAAVHVHRCCSTPRSTLRLTELLGCCAVRQAADACGALRAAQLPALSTARGWLLAGLLLLGKASTTCAQHTAHSRQTWQCKP